MNKSRVQAFSTQNSLKTKEINLTHEVKSTWNKIQSLISSIKSLEVSVESNEVALEGVIKEAGVGTQTTLNILDAQKELTEAEANLVNAQYNLIESSYKLLQSCGLIILTIYKLDKILLDFCCFFNIMKFCFALIIAFTQFNLKIYKGNYYATRNGRYG